MLPVQSVGRFARVTPVGNHGAREIERPALLVQDHLDPRGIRGELGIERRGSGADVVAQLEAIDRACQRLPRNERLVPLNIHDDVVGRELGPCRRFGDPIGSA